MLRLASPLLALALAGCAAAAFDTAAREDTEAAYRRFLARYPAGAEASRAANRLETLAFQRARRGDDIASYNRFLAEHPEGDLAAEARERRAWARLRRALAEGGAEPLRRVAEEDGATEAGERARSRLRELEAVRAGSSDSPDVLRDYLLAFPEGEGRERIERRLDDLEFEAARQGRSEAAVRAYLEAHPSGLHRAEAEELLETLASEAAMAAGRVDGMEAFLREHPGSPAAAAVSRALAEALLARARVTLDPELARRALALDADGPAAPEAEALLATLGRGGARGRRARDLVAALTGGLPLRSADELRSALESADPRDRWNAVREAALGDAPASLDVLVEAAGTDCPLQLLYARAALVGRGGRPGPGGSSRLEAWADRLRPRSSNPEDLLRLGAVSEALGEDAAAVHAFRSAAADPERGLAAALAWALVSASAAGGAERDVAAGRALDLGRARLEELLDLTPERVEADQLDRAVLIVRRLEALERVVTRLFGALGGDGVDASDTAQDLARLAAAAAAAGRRLAARVELADAGRLTEGADPLSTLAAEHLERRVGAAEALGRLRAVEAVPALAEAARGEAGEVARAAVRALGAIPGAEAGAALVDLAHDRAGPPAEVASALREAARRAPPSVRAGMLEAAAALEAAGGEDGPGPATVEAP